MVAILALSPASAAAPEGDQVIRMGEGIGKVRMGMTIPQVRRALGGRHLVVYRRQNFGARGRYLELGWELPGRTAWEPAIWQVGFRSRTRRGTMRVVRVSSDTPSQRTTKGFGVGSRSRDLVRAYPEATCVFRFPQVPHWGMYIVVNGPRGGMTAFQIADRSQQARPTPYYVVSVLVQRTWFSEGRGHDSCPPGWKDF
jgi:hypothetical protein